MRKKWRSIVVNQQPYKWYVEDVTMYGNLRRNQLELRLRLSGEHKNSTRCVVNFTQPQESLDELIITPSVVAECINHALKNGWDFENTSEILHIENGFEIWQNVTAAQRP
ncbi:MAG: hypothetical protein LCI00_17735 [Chloroflexi bacterium]|nr:hypothetical protein [Chloroflexota bacterium]MCC6893818.1 hypothetical protein [Anaerolineae bacterium]